MSLPKKKVAHAKSAARDPIFPAMLVIHYIHGVQIILDVKSFSNYHRRSLCKMEIQLCEKKKKKSLSS